MPGMKKRARKKMLIGGIAKGIAKGIKSFKNKKKIAGGVAVGAGATQVKKRPQAETTPKTKTVRKSAKTSGLKNLGKTTKVTPVKNAVRSKDGKIVRSKSGKAVTFGGANKGGARSREGRMGGGMMKKRMKRGGRAK